jgi:hypothetical protein
VKKREVRTQQRVKNQCPGAAPSDGVRALLLPSERSHTLTQTTPVVVRVSSRQTIPNLHSIDDALDYDRDALGDKPLTAKPAVIATAQVDENVNLP